MRKWTEMGLGVLGLSGVLTGAVACSSGNAPSSDERAGEPVAYESQAQTPAFAAAHGGARLLSKKQYLRSIAYLLGTAARDAAAPVAWDGPTGENFVAAAAFKQSVSGAGPAFSISEAADAAARAAVLTRTNAGLPLATFASCTTQATPNANAREVCYGQVATTIGRAAFRVPLLPEQQALLVAIGKQAEGSPETGQTAFDSGLHQILSALLQSASFLYSPEVGSNPSAAGSLSKYQLATRLSLTLLGRIPTVELLDSAEAGGLDTPALVEAVARQMLTTQEGKDAYLDMVEEWFLLDEFDEQFRPSFPKFTTVGPNGKTLREEMKEEAQRYLLDIAFGTPAFSTNPTPFPQIYSSQKRFITQFLADNIYTQAPINVGTGWQLVDFANHHNQLRAGILTMPAWLTVFATDHRTKIIGRGKFTWQRVLCGIVQPPPGGVVGMMPTPDFAAKTTFRSLLANHATGSCSVCHVKFDPGGYSLENLDQIGAYRTIDVNGGGGTIDPNAFIAHPGDTTNPVFIIDGLDYGKIVANPDFPNSERFIENTTVCQWTQLHESFVGERMQQDVQALDGALVLTPTAELAAFRAAVLQGVPPTGGCAANTPGSTEDRNCAQYFYQDFVAKLVSSSYFMTIGAPR